MSSKSIFMTDKNHFQISIPEPCSEDWGAMTPDAQGRFCGVCQKSVIDFTGKTPDEIARILSERLGQKVCGRFRKEQLTTNYRLEIPLKRYTTMRLSPVKAFTLALLIAFGSSLLSCTDGKGERRRVEVSVSDEQPSSSDRHTADSSERAPMGEPVIIEEDEVMGKVIAPPDTVTPPEIMGDIAIPPDSVTPPKPPKKPREIIGEITSPRPPEEGKVTCDAENKQDKQEEATMGAVYIPPKK